MRTLIFALLILASTVVKAQADSNLVKTLIKIKANLFTIAYKARDYDRYITFTHPALVESVGGKEKLKAMMAETFASCDVSGADITPPNHVIYYKGTIQSLLRQDVSYTCETDTINVSNNVIVISYDKGMTWYFLGTGEFKVEELRKYFPELSPELGL